jgi:hypothetical protein
MPYKKPMPHIHRSLFTAVALALAVLSAGCSTAGFKKEWQRAALGPESARPIEGRWQGTWLSDKNGHTGELRCIISHTHGKNYRFDYWSSFWKVLRYRTTLSFRVVEQKDGSHQFTGAEDLGPAAGGVYEYQGSFTGDQFTAAYKNKYDHGTFQMRRVN